MAYTDIENGFKLVGEEKTVHVGPADGLPPATEYPIGTVIESADGERFRLDRVPNRTAWVAVEARQPEKKDYSKFSVRDLIVAATAGDEDAATALEERLTAVHTVPVVAGAAPEMRMNSTSRPISTMTVAPETVDTVVRYVPDPEHPGLFRAVHEVIS